MQVYNDEKIRNLICFICGQIKTGTGGLRSRITRLPATYLIDSAYAVWKDNVLYEERVKLYGEVQCTHASDWVLSLREDVAEEVLSRPDLNAYNQEHGEDAPPAIKLLCCPEDRTCTNTCDVDATLCRSCLLPMCRECRYYTQQRTPSAPTGAPGRPTSPEHVRCEAARAPDGMPPTTDGCDVESPHARAGAKLSTANPIAMVNDMYYGYVDRFIFNVDVTWMEMTCASPFWTGMTMVTISRIPTHLTRHRLFQSSERVGFRGHVYNAPLQWRENMEQIEAIDKREARIALPHVGAVLASIVHVHVSGGLMELNRHLKEITVRRDAVVRLILMLRDSGHVDYRPLDEDSVRAQAAQLADVPDGSTPARTRGIDHLFPTDDDIVEDLVIDKAATPAEPPQSIGAPQRALRPGAMLLERDMDAGRHESGARASAFSRYANIDLKTGSKLLEQFESHYVPRVFPFTIPGCVGGPDVKGRPRHRRPLNAPQVPLDPLHPRHGAEGGIADAVG